MTVNSFTSKQLRVTFVLSGTDQVFPGTNSNTLVLTGLRMSAKVRTVARLSPLAELRVWGMLPADMNALTAVWANPPVVRDHIVTIEANSGNGWVQVFRGTILEAQPEYSAAPDVYFHVQAKTGYFQQIEVESATPTSYPDSVSAEVAILDLIERMGFQGEVTADVNAVLTNPYWSGTLFDQFVKACKAAGADFYILGESILVTASGKPRTTEPAVVLNASSGLDGYPVYERAGLNVTALFDPAFLCGTPLELQCDVPSATGRWYPFAIEQRLDVLLPKGKWHSYLQCLRVLV